MNKRILIIEDEENICELLRMNLKFFSYDVFVARDGASGIKMVYETKPDLLLLDIRLNGMSGLDVCRKIRSDPNLGNIYIIALSAAAQENEIRTVMAAGANEFIPKPFDLRMLIERANRV